MKNPLFNHGLTNMVILIGKWEYGNCIQWENKHEKN